MSFLSKLFGSKPTPPSPKDVEGELRKLEEEAEDALPAYVGTAFNRAGDLALRDGQADRAVGYYGRAIDAFLDDAQREAARGVANKIIRVRPSAVRTLSTLTWLDLAARHQATALLHLRDYAAAADEAGEQKRAATQVHAMARVSNDHEFLYAAADALDHLGFVNRAKEVRSWTRTGAPEALAEDGDLGAACLEAAVRSNDPAVVLLDDDVEVAPDVEDVEGESDVEDEPDLEDEPDVDGASEHEDESEPLDEAEDEEASVDELSHDEAGGPEHVDDDVPDDPEVGDEPSDSDESGASKSSSGTGKKSRKKRRKKKR